MHWWQWTVDNATAFRMWFFFGSLLILGTLEYFLPRRKLNLPRSYRWVNNFSLTFLNTILIRALYIGTGLYFSTMALKEEWGVLNHLELPVWLQVLTTVLVLDMCIYWQHRLFHTTPLLWRLHRVHHIDRDFDISTSARFHTVEILLSLLIKISIIIAFGAHAAGIVLFEILLNTSSNFNHANIRIPEKLDRILQWFIVTPDMHRIHHSETMKHTNSNYSFSISIWDRLFGTYTALSYEDNNKEVIGLMEYRDPKENRIDQMLANPFR